MKKILVALTSIIVLASCTTANNEGTMKSANHNKEMVMMHNEMKKEMKEEKIKLTDENGNVIVFRTNDGYESGVVTIKGIDRNVKRVVTASGIAFESADGFVYFAMKGNEGFVELNKVRFGGDFTVEGKDNYINVDEETNLVYQNQAGERLQFIGTGNDTAKVIFRGTEYKVTRIITASGLAYETKDKFLYFAMKGNEGYLEMAGVKNNFLLLNRTMMHNNKIDRNMNIMTPLVYQSKDGERLNFMARENDKATVVFRGKEYTLSRMVTASGAQYRTRDGLFDFSMKGNEGYLRMGSSKIDFQLLDK